MSSPNKADRRSTALTLVRVRLALALAATAVVSMAVGALVSAAAGPEVGLDPLSILSIVPLPAMSVALILVAATAVLATWMSLQVLRPAEELELANRETGELYRMAQTHALEDSLTGLPNHRAFQEEFDRQIEAARRYHRPFALLVIDLDDFKLVNDSSGHAAGDDVLVDMGGLMRGSIRRSDRPFRIGGDEFAVLMPDTDSDGAEIVARRLLGAAVEPRTGSMKSQPFSFSGGISAYGGAHMTRSEMFAQADAALYEAKHHGRTGIRVYDAQAVRAPRDRETVSRASALVAMIVETGAIRPVYQPIVELVSGRIVGYEGLVRPEPDHGFANAGELFEAAEAGGRTFELDMACVAVVAAGAAGLPGDLLLSVNVSPRTLEAAEFSAAHLVRILADHGIAASRVILELTEREVVEDVERLRAVLAACQAAGMRVAADDIGAGNAGLQLLSQIHFDIVKIDLSLVQAGARRETSLDVLRSLTDLAAAWGAFVIAEGVETAAQLRILRDIGIPAAQGYLLGRPGDSVAGGSVDLAALVTPTADVPEAWAARVAWPGPRVGPVGDPSAGPSPRSGIAAATMTVPAPRRAG